MLLYGLGTFWKGSQMEIAGKKAVIVGGASGFGKATAEALAKRGASVAVLDRPQSTGKEVAESVGGLVKGERWSAEGPEPDPRAGV